LTNPGSLDVYCFDNSSSNNGQASDVSITAVTADAFN